ncbi:MULTISPECIES: CoA transferase [Arthrobacter]|uniref:CoA transferase n=1 Tax=unclassified Arthrobacter TaxID=235627 RepID=UPI0024B8B75A|nr:CoA transferase [Arthrobacter sp. H35-MC1]MDJ0318816.1 CoA transferase [Arthrobacter sp. H35-MC1]
MTNPLAGIVIVTVAINLPGPLAASRLAELGARVIKVEPLQGDPLRSVAPGWYDELVAGQEVISLDLKDPSSRSSFEELLAQADVLLTSMRPSALNRLNLGETLRNHGIALVEIVGHDGPLSEQPGHDLTYQAAHGTLLPPDLPLIPVADLLGSERAVVATLMALRQKDQGVKEIHEKVVLDVAAHAAAAGVRHGLTSPGAILGGAVPTYGIYQSADGYIAVGALEPHFAARLQTHIGSTREEITREFASQPNSHWAALGQAHDLPLVPVLLPGDAATEYVAATSSQRSNSTSTAE